MGRRRLLIGCGAAILLAVAGFAFVHWLTTPPPGVTLENFRRLRQGMTISEVEALLGEPYQRNSRGAFNTFLLFSRAGESIYSPRWKGEEIVILLSFFPSDNKLSSG